MSAPGAEPTASDPQPSAPGEGPPRRGVPRGGLPWMIARRYLRGRQSRLLGSTARAALLAVALGVTAMVIAMALMTGYREDLQRKLVGGNAAVVASPLSTGQPEPRAAALEQVRAIAGITNVALVGYARGTASSAASPGGVEVTVRGIEPGGTHFFGDPAQLRPDAAGIPALVGGELARQLEVATGDSLRVVLLTFTDGRPRFRFHSVRVAGSFDTGFAEFDASWVLVDLGALEALVGAGDTGRLVEVAVDDPARAPQIAEQVERALGSDYLVTDWQMFNRELFTALQLQQMALFLVLGLIVVVSTFNVASTLVVLVRERRRDIGVLAALGLSPVRLRLTFLLYGLTLGALGIAIGVGAGVGAAWVLDRFRLIRFGPEVAAIYFIDAVPFRVEPADVLAIVGFSLLVTLVACWLPSRRAVRLDPSSALRYE